MAINQSNWKVFFRIETKKNRVVMTNWAIFINFAFCNSASFTLSNSRVSNDCIAKCRFLYFSEMKIAQFFTRLQISILDKKLAKKMLVYKKWETNYLMKLENFSTNNSFFKWNSKLMLRCVKMMLVFSFFNTKLFLIFFWFYILNVIWDNFF